MSFVLSHILKKDYVEFVQVIAASGYLQGDLSLILSDVRGRLSELSAKRVFLSKTKKTVNDEVTENEKKVKEPKEKKVKEPKEKKAKRMVIPSAYMCFLTDKRSEIKMLLKEETPDISAKDLNMSVMKKAGEIWKVMTDDDKKPYLDKSSSLKTGSLSVQEQVQGVQEQVQGVQEQVQTKADVVEAVSVPTSADDEVEADEDVLVYNASFNVWVHEVSGMYYGADDIDGEPLGQLKNGKLVPFKKPSTTKKRVSQ